MRRGQARAARGGAIDRWGLDGCTRIESALRRYAQTQPNYKTASLSLGLSEHYLGRVLARSDNLTVSMAEALAAKLGTTADDIAKGLWKPEGRAA